MPTTPEVSGSHLRRTHSGYAEQPAGDAEWTRPLRDNAVRGCDLLKSMAHEGRLIILCLLSEQERSVTELEEALDLRQPAVSQQLARLRSDRLVATRRDGKMIFYSLASDEVRRIVKTMCDMYSGDAKIGSR